MNPVRLIESASSLSRGVPQRVTQAFKKFHDHAFASGSSVHDGLGLNQRVNARDAGMNGRMGISFFIALEISGKLIEV